MGTECCYVYFLQCTGGPGGRGIYIGSAVDVDARFSRHVAGQGAVYTKTHPPVGILAILTYSSRTDAVRVERQLKRLPSIMKEQWVHFLAYICPICVEVGVKIPLMLAEGHRCPAVVHLEKVLEGLERPLRRRVECVLQITCAHCTRV